MKKKNLILLTFYKFVDVKNPHEVVAEHLSFCTDIGLKGRVYIGEEGISATLTGNNGQIKAYRIFLESGEYFKNIEDIDIKATKVEDYFFDRMIVKYRKEIVALGKTVNEEQIKKYKQEVSIEEFHKIVESNDPNYAILDMRNTYEYKLGHFKGAIPAGTNNFRETQDLLKLYREKFDGKKVIMYCTGGIRCEKLAVLLNEEGINNFYSINGGVVKYVNTINDGSRLGNLYTFDGRVSTLVGDDKTHTTIGECIYSGLKTNHCENCRYSECNARIICRPKYFKYYMGFCSEECFQNSKERLLIKNADFDTTDYQAIRIALKNSKPDAIARKNEAIAKLEQILENRKFPHKTSQKEELVDKDYINQFFEQH